jgi:protein required for attachment to host cells
MDDTGVTWIIVADAHEMRVFAERARTGPVHELPEWRMVATDDERAAHHHHATQMGAEHEGERRFLRRVAARVGLACTRGEFERLVLMGPPHALGRLKAELPPAAAARIDATDPHERVHDDADAVRRHLRDARARTWA